MNLEYKIQDGKRYLAYVTHHETYPFDDIALYSGWLAYGSSLTYPLPPERVMRQFDYMQFVPRDTSVSAPPAMTRRDMDVMFDDYLNHSVLEEARSTIAPSD